jgi:hypothetical protein
MRPPAALGSKDMSVYGRIGRKEKSLLTLIVFGSWFIDDCAVLQTSKIKHTDTAICATAHKYICTICTKSNIKDLFVVGY